MPPGLRGLQNWESGSSPPTLDAIGKASDDGPSDGSRGRQLSNDEVAVSTTTAMDYGHGVRAAVTSREVKSVSFYC